MPTAIAVIGCVVSRVKDKEEENVKAVEIVESVNDRPPQNEGEALAALNQYLANEWPDVDPGHGLRLLDQARSEDEWIAFLRDAKFLRPRCPNPAQPPLGPAKNTYSVGFEASVVEANPKVLNLPVVSSPQPVIKTAVPVWEPPRSRYPPPNLPEGYQLHNPANPGFGPVKLVLSEPGPAEPVHEQVSPTLQPAAFQTPERQPGDAIQRTEAMVIEGPPIVFNAVQPSHNPQQFSDLANYRAKLEALICQAFAGLETVLTPGELAELAERKAIQAQADASWKK
jgi:hypothetical protein